MPVVTVNPIGRFGNQMFQYASARGFAEAEGFGFAAPEWMGEQVFDLQDERPHTHEDMITWNAGYGQSQVDITYTRSQVKEWFKFKPEVDKKMSWALKPNEAVHLRRGDYQSLGYVCVSIQSYFDAVNNFGYKASQNRRWFSEAYPFTVDGLPDWLPDFYLMTKAQTIFRANSTYSWWAATLSDAKVYSPIVTGKEGGRVQDCEFVEGNWPKFADLPCCTDLHLPE